MKDLQITAAGHDYHYDCPETWADLSQSDFEVLVRVLDRQANKAITKEIIAKVIKPKGLTTEERETSHIDLGVALLLDTVDWWRLGEMLEWMLDIETLDGLLMEKLYIKEGDKVVEELVGYEPDFCDTTWKEFIDADTYAMAGNNLGLCSVLYRKLRVPYDKDKDPREEYTQHGAAVRREAMANGRVSLFAMEAARVNYMVLRDRMARRYPHVFRHSSAEEGQGGESFSWLKATKNIVGEHIQHWDSYLALPVDVVLSRIEAGIVEHIEWEKKNRR